MSTSSTPQRADALVVGAGPAGLSAALTLARFDRGVTVIDSGYGRSTFHQTNHNYLGFPEGVGAQELRRLGQLQLARYPHVDLVDATVERVDGGSGGAFTATCRDNGSHQARVVILATGVVDHYPRFPGWEEYVGRSMFWCITCDGYESRGRDVIVVGNDDAAATEALQLLSLTDRVRVLTNSDSSAISERIWRRLGSVGIPVLHDRIANVEGKAGMLRALHTVGGQTFAVEALFSVQGASPRSDLADQLGVELDKTGWIAVDTEQKTSVPGVYAAGDVTALHSHQVATAVHEGTQAACAANYYLYPDVLKDA